MTAASFFKFARDRHEIYVRRSRGLERESWTTDPIFRKYRFTNVFRELDKTTVWFRENVREPLQDDPRVLLATVAFRWFNRIETGRVLKWGQGRQMQDLFQEWDSDLARHRLRRSGPPWTTGAYIIKTPDGFDKLNGVLWCIDQFNNLDRPIERPNSTVNLDWWMVAVLCRDMVLQSGFAHHGQRERTSKEIGLQQFHRWLLGFPYLGPFMAYEIVTDLRHTALLRSAPDVNTWANPGPGARRGLNRVHGRDFKKTISTDQCIAEMRELLPSFRANFDGVRVPHTPELREVEHTLCEFDKYERVRLGQGRPRGVFQ